MRASLSRTVYLAFVALSPWYAGADDPCKPEIAANAVAQPLGYASRDSSDDPYCEGEFRQLVGVSPAPRLEVLSVGLAAYRTEGAPPARLEVFWPFSRGSEAARICVRPRNHACLFRLDGGERTPEASDEKPDGLRGEGCEVFRWDSRVIQQFAKTQSTFRWQSLEACVTQQFSREELARRNWPATLASAPIHVPIVFGMPRARGSESPGATSKPAGSAEVAVLIVANQTLEVTDAVLRRVSTTGEVPAAAEIKPIDRPRDLLQTMNRMFRFHVPCDESLWVLLIRFKAQERAKPVEESAPPIYILAPSAEFAEWARG